MIRDDPEEPAGVVEIPNNRIRGSRITPAGVAAWDRLWDDAEDLYLDPVWSRSSFDCGTAHVRQGRGASG
jgi:hypothetical protein